MGFFTQMPSKPSADEIAKKKRDGKVVHSQCEGRGKVSIGGNVTDCPGCNGSGFV